jgi:hypothetical protein
MGALEAKEQGLPTLEVQRTVMMPMKLSVEG